MQIEKLFLAEKYKKVVEEADPLIGSRSHRRDELYYIKGLSQLKLDRFKDARESFEKVLSRYPKSKKIFDAHIGIGDSYFLEGNVNMAAKIYEDILNRFPDEKNISLVYYKLGNCFKMAGSYERGKYYFDKVKKLSSLSFEAKMIPGSALKKVSQDKVNKFSVQVGSFKNKKNAENLTAKLSKEGYDSYIETLIDSSYKLYRVKVGRLGSKEEAENLLARLKRSGYSTKICAKDIYE